MDAEEGKNLQNTTKKEPRLLKKTREAIKLVEMGLTPKEALQATNFKKDISDAGVAKFREKLRKYSLQSPAVVHSAHRQVKRILRGEAREVARQKITNTGQVIDYKEKIVPTDSNIIAAASMVYDRYEPIQAQEQAPQGNTYIDLRRYINAPIVLPTPSTP